MEILDLGQVMNAFVLHLCIYFILARLINFKKCSREKVIIILILIFFLSVSYEILKLNTNRIYAFLFSYILYSIFIKFITNKELIYSIIVTLFSYAISYIFFAVTSLLVSCVSVIVFKIEEPNFITFLVLDCLTLLFIYLFLNIKKFKNGLYFLQNEETIETIGTFVVPISGIIIISYILTIMFTDPENASFWNYSLLIGSIVSICMYIWIRKALSAHYQNRMKDRTIESLENELKQTKQELDNALEENYMVAQESHKINHKINTLKNVVTKMVMNPTITKQFREEYGTEFGDFIEEVNKLSDKYSNAIKTNKVKKLLPKTNIFALDSVFEYMQLEALKDDINFELKLNGSIHYMIENFISEDKLATLLSDHIKDALIAVKVSSNSYRNITVILGAIDKNYGLCIYDSGIEFEVNTLVNIGFKPVTTHSDSGGTGFGFMTTFETLNEFKASLVIKEKKPSKSDYTKSISIIFDNKNEYRIISYRANEIRKKDVEKRIIINALKN